MMFCENCHTAVSEDDVIRKSECLGECHGVPAWNYYNTCPHCGSDEIYEAQTCPACGEYYNGEEDYCENCQKAIHEQNDEFINSVQNYFDIDYEEALSLIVCELERR